MENDCCFILAIRQISCQNNINRCFDNVYTNITSGSNIPLEFGYNITCVAVTCSHVIIRISNPNFIPTLLFNIPCNSFKRFDLPQEAGTLNVLVGAKEICCPTSCANCNYQR